MAKPSRQPLSQEVTYEPHPLGSICSSFENQTLILLKDFTAREIYNLLSRRERKLITRRADGFIWKLVRSMRRPAAREVSGADSKRDRTLPEPRSFI